MTQTPASQSDAPIDAPSSGQVDDVSPDSPRPLIATIAIILFYILGIFFVVSAVTKALDFKQFVLQVALYRVVIDSDMIRLSAMGTLAIETFLAVALIFRLWPRKITLPIALILLAVFTGLIAYAWKYHNLEDCGCFGKYLTMTPLQSIIKNLVLMAMLGWLWIMSGPTVVPLWSPRRFRTAGALFVALGALNIGLARPQPSSVQPPKTNPEDSDQPRNPYAYLVQTEDGQEFDLEVGDYLVVLLSTTCEHCMDAVPKLNQMPHEVEGFPQIIGLCLGDDESLATFREETFPEFPTQLIDELEFFKLLDEKPPRFVALRDGKVLKAWEAEEPPEGYEIIEALWLTDSEN